MSEMTFPNMVTLTQAFENSPLENPAQYLEEKLAAMDLPSRIKPGQTVAITAGSRGVTDMVPVIKTLVSQMKAIGAEPFIFPSMGSHGGATDEGQAGILEALGITEESCGAPIKSSMETVHLGETVRGIPVYVDANAHGADHIVVVNRVKPHTDFEGEIESGLTKMMAIGMGKQRGAETYHNAILEYGYYDTFTTVVDVILEKAPVTLGVGIVENQLDRTEEIGAAWGEDIPALDRSLLAKAKSVFPRLPFDYLDLLIVDEMGKDISGTGMDQNIIARTV
ncbi:MAG: nickel-dependent lactate racemase, partial [Desulfobacterales bacterium]|nr:nickel-dependent lactate racemase [Desulfobacterales bacterium]